MPSPRRVRRRRALRGALLLGAVGACWTGTLGALADVPAQRHGRAHVSRPARAHAARCPTRAVRPHTCPPRRRHAKLSSHALYWGAWIGSQLTGGEAPWDYRAVARFDENAGRDVSLVSFSSPFTNCSSTPCVPYRFPSAPFSRIRANGSIPFFSWSSASLPVSPLEPGHRLRDVIEGRFDGYILSWAGAARGWGHPFFLRFDWEMNASTFPWSVGANGNAPAEYVAAWKHVHDLFRRAGARNATWVWCPNADPAQSPAALRALYPGSAYVDWTCLDGYNRGGPWRQFAAVFKPFYETITAQIAPGKPMVIGETASTETGGSKAGWIAGMFSSLAAMPAIHGLVWFDRTTGAADWPVESSPSSLQAFRAGIGRSIFLTNRFSEISTSPIPAP